jgi:hypothetical protein
MIKNLGFWREALTLVVIAYKLCDIKGKICHYCKTGEITTGLLNKSIFELTNTIWKYYRANILTKDGCIQYIKME